MANNIEFWNFEKNGNIFYCEYDRKTDWVKVSCCEFPNLPTRGALGGATGYKRIAKLLACELLKINNGTTGI